MTIELTRKELELLCAALRAGIGDDGIETIGLSQSEQYKLAKVANRLSKLAGQGEPYYES
jgi:hypothetical protein